MTAVSIPSLHTKRLAVEFSILTIGQEIEIASMPELMVQAEMTAFLKAAVKSVASGGDPDPRNWTVQERILAVAHYLSATEPDPDFAAGDGRYSDYPHHEVDIDPDVLFVDVDSVGGDHVRVRHLTGRMAEAIERASLDFNHALTPYTQWLVLAMASQLVINFDEGPEEDGPLEDWINSKAKTFLNYPTNEFQALIDAYFQGVERLYHLFQIDFSTEGGIVVQPKRSAQGGAGLHPATFPARACISRTAIALSGKPA